MSFDHPEVRAVEGRAAGFQQGIARRLRQFCRVGSMALALCTASFGATVALANPSLGEAVAAARTGDARAQYIAGMMYLFGQGARRDVPEGARWLLKSAQAGLPQAMVSLAGLYDVGVGVPFDPTRAVQLRQQAARAGYAMAKSQLDIDARLPGARDYRRASVLTDLKLYAAAVPYARRSAAAGYLEGQELLGRAYHLGLGVGVDRAAALRLYETAAAGGLVQAMRDVAFMYQFGEGVRPDRGKALAYYDRAAARGSKTARWEAANLRAGNNGSRLGGGGSSSDPYQAAQSQRCDGAGGRWQNGQCVVDGNGNSINP